MPDVYNRLQAGTKAVTLGSMSILLGIAIHFPQWWPRILVIAAFILLTNPVGSSTVARTALLNGVKPWQREEGSWQGRWEADRKAVCVAHADRGDIPGPEKRPVDLYASLIAFSVVSLGLAILFVLLRAPDVAMTEATVGAGLGSLLFALAIRRVSSTGSED